MSSPRERALAYVRTHNVVTLATSGPEGIWAAAVFYAEDSFKLIFLSAEHTRHARNIASQSHVAATIQEDYADWPGIQGIQLEGTARKLSGAEREKAVNRYKLKYPFVDRPITSLATALSKVSWYVIEPQRLYFVDNTRGFGHRDEIDLNIG
ncbi:MAG: pyridoxamine 5'-phosphate oxidase family protein [Anaerolineae bacterium]|nr:pyridoxamine 5'-phosphate oxidase family protein [Anaerolineae bacterium]